VHKNDIWVVCDRLNDCGHGHLKQIISKASQLAGEDNRQVSVICIGSFRVEQLVELGVYGADKIIFCLQEDCLDEIGFANVLAEVICNEKPKLIMYPASPFGKAVAAYCSARFEAGIVVNCINIEKNNEGILVFTSMDDSHFVIAKIVFTDSEIQMCTVRNDVFVIKETRLQYEPVIDRKIVTNVKGNNPIITEVLGNEPIVENDDFNRLTTAKLIFAFGRGIENEKNVELLKRIAKKYKAQLVGTRAVVEDGLISRTLQVGQSGTSVAPDIYVGYGISGAIQHVAGIKDSKLIIAVNKNENAQIFRYSDIAIVGDAINILLELDKL